MLLEGCSLACIMNTADFVLLTQLNHLKSTKYTSHKKTKLSNIGRSVAVSSSSKQVTLPSVATGFHQYFILDCIRMCTQADNPLETNNKAKAFLQEHCTHTGDLPGLDQLRTTYVSRLFD